MFLLERLQIIDQPVKYTTEPDGSNWLEVELSRCRAIVQNMSLTEKCHCR